MEYAAKFSDWFAGGLEKGEKNEGLHAHYVMSGVKMPGGKPGIDALRADLRHYLIGDRTGTPLKVHIAPIDGAEETVERKVGYVMKDRSQVHFAGARSRHLTEDFMKHRSMIMSTHVDGGACRARKGGSGTRGTRPYGTETRRMMRMNKPYFLSYDWAVPLPEVF